MSHTLLYPAGSFALDVSRTSRLRDGAQRGTIGPGGVSEGDGVALALPIVVEATLRHDTERELLDDLERLRVAIATGQVFRQDAGVTLYRRLRPVGEHAPITVEPIDRIWRAVLVRFTLYPVFPRWTETNESTLAGYLAAVKR